MFVVGGRNDTSEIAHSIETSAASEKLGATADSGTSTPQYYAQPERPVERFMFDPNTADSTQLLRLGLQSWQVRNIYKYRAAGGIYRTKEDFAKLYGLTVKQYRELEPFIQISSDYLPAATLIKEEKTTYERDTLRHPQKITEGETIDLNAGDTTIYRKVPGIGSYYARKIMDYGNKLGGYVSIDQLDEIAKFPQAAKKFFALPSGNVRQLYINHLSLNELKQHPYISYAQAKAIIDYRRLYGDIHSLQELSLLPAFSHQAIIRLEPYISYN
jgi:DNA uptake protein ComE-like DNA-binding protein